MSHNLILLDVSIIAYNHGNTVAFSDLKLAMKVTCFCHRDNEVVGFHSYFLGIY